MMHITVEGGDRRFRLLEDLLRQRGFSVNKVSMEETDAVILPLPAFDAQGHVRGSSLTEETLLAAQLQQHTLLLGGQLPAGFLQKAAARHLRALDYYLDETLLVQNAAATAEGALALLIEQLPAVLCGSAIAVVGFGRIGSRLAKLLQGLGADVTVFARSAKARTEAAASGICARPLQALQHHGTHFAAVCNTAPAAVADEAVLRALGSGTIWLELAAKPGGLCPDTAEKCGICVVDGSGLPGRFSPQSAAEYLCDAICKIIDREGFHV